jgi:UDP-N-acetylmuramoyl-L-alanyl-D-glutamate--2,6-diaminopimelate ligase
VTLSDLIREMEVTAVRGDPHVPVKGLALDSRRVSGGDLFFALAGVKRDGGAFVDAAFAAGASAAVVARGVAAAHAPVVEVEEPRLALAQAACSFHGHPSRALKVAAVTGTNGKTTTTWMLESIFRAAGMKAGRIGTTGYRVGDETRPAPFTTPEAPELQALLREMADLGVKAVALEASSHALAQRRTWGLECDVVLFTNLTQDHLDYHGTMEAYLDAKLMLFDGRNGRGTKRTVAVVNGSDPHAARVIAAAKHGGLEVLVVGLDLEDAAPALALDMHVERIDPRPDGLELQAWVGIPKRLARATSTDPEASRGAEVVFHVPLLGRYNAVNAILAYGAALALGVRHGAIARGLGTLPAVPGRLERISAGQAFAVLVDYAHTPDALERALAAAREHFTGRVLLVFGAGGDRDRGKRPLMGRLAATLADRAWITNDNPRSEDPRAIADQIAAGAPGARLDIVLDRREAIAAALAEARSGDAVLIAGKGHETTQTVGDRVLPFDDREVARTLLLARPGARA